MPNQQMTFGGPKDGRPNPATPGENGPNYGKQIDRWKSQLKGDVSKKRQHKLRNKIQNARVDRWSDQVRAQANAPVAHDSIYNDALDAANKGYNDRINAAFKDTVTTNRDYGFGLDPATGQWKPYEQNSAMYNPYSRASELAAAWQRDQRTTLNSYAAAGQLYSGARENAVAHDNRAYLSDLNTTLSEQKDILDRLNLEPALAEEARQDAIKQAGYDELKRIEDSPPEDAPPPPKFIRKEKRSLKNRISRLKEQRSEAENKAKRKKISKQIKKAKKNLNSIPNQYSEGKP